MAGYKENVKQLTLRPKDVRPGDRVIALQSNPVYVVVERDESELPTRVVAKAFYHPMALKCLVVVPDSFVDEDVTCILGRDELPEEVRSSANCTLPGNGTYDPEGPAWIMGRFIRTRWPEAFK